MSAAEQGQHLTHSYHTYSFDLDLVVIGQRMVDLVGLLQVVIIRVFVIRLFIIRVFIIRVFLIRVFIIQAFGDSIAVVGRATLAFVVFR